jgi:M6 family metalloprotease-like protein
MRSILSFFAVAITFLFNPAIGRAQPVLPDTIHILAIRVEFVEDNAATTTGNGKFDLSQSSGQFQIDPPPHNRSYFQDHILFVSNYFKKVSRERLHIEGDVFPVPEDNAYQLDHPMTYYNPNTTPDENDRSLANLFRDALLKADEDPAINFSQYQSFVVFHAGVGKDVDIGFDETPQDIPSLFLTSEFLFNTLGVTGITVDNGAVTVNNGMILPETESQVGIELGLNGIFTSNFGSQLGWLDLFSPETRRTGIGRFGLMDAGLFNGDGLLPALPCAWTRLRSGWEDWVNLYYSPNDELTIHSTLSHNLERVYLVPINYNEYFLVENRYSGELSFDSLQYVIAQQRNEYPTAREILETYFPDQATFSTRGVLIDVDNPDIGLPGTGCLIWHIDENVIARNRAENRINADSEHRGVDLEEADGSQDIGQEYSVLSAGAGSEIGYVLDMWYVGNNSPLFKNEFSPNSTPNSRSYYNRANSHIKIFKFSAPDSQMTFQVRLDIFQQNFPVIINPYRYGRATTMKTADLNLDGTSEIILTTDQNQILAVNKDGRSLWGTFSYLVANIAEQILPPPVFFNDPVSPGVPGKDMVVLTESGKVLGFKFSNSAVDTLFTPLQLSTSITTYPIGYEDIDETRVYWGAENGRVYQLNLNSSGVTLDSLSGLNESVKYIHLNYNGDVLAITASGKVYRNGVFVKDNELPYFSPVGVQAAGLTRDGKFLEFEAGEQSYAEEGIYQFDSPMVVNPFYATGMKYQPYYLVAGNNRIYSFNPNFSMLDNFPVKIYHPDRPVELSLSPLVNIFYRKDLQEAPGVIVADPAGLIDGFDFSGDRLDDFPLAVGDSIVATPVILDIDADSTLDLAAITGQGTLYIWDLQSKFYKYGWNQLYANELNSNNNLVGVAVEPGEPSSIAGSELMPEKMVYNWPNPNIEDYTFIRYYLTDRAEVKIKIYDLAGDFVEDFSGPGDAQTANEVRWNLQNVQSGVYLARIEAKSSNKSEVKIIKIAVVK